MTWRRIYSLLARADERARSYDDLRMQELVRMTKLEIMKEERKMNKLNRKVNGQLRNQD